MKKIVVLIAVLCAGCSITNSPVVPMGKDSYLISATGRGGYSQGQVMISATQAANEYCEKQGRHMITRRMDSSGMPGWTPVSGNFVFSCVTEDDPEYQRPNLSRDPNVLIQDQRK